METDPLVALSDRTAALVAAASAHVVRVEGSHRGPASGAVWSADGVVVTTGHALERDEEIEVLLPSGEPASAEVIGRDPTTDLAALRVRAPGLAPAAFGDAGGLSTGEVVLAVSRPGKSVRASLGLLARSAGEWRGPGGGRIDRFLETTFDLHPGLSGALATRADGTAVGIVTAGLARGAAMIVPSETLRRVVKALLSHGCVRRGYLGVSMIPVRLPDALARACGQGGALLVSGVEPESPASRGGVLIGDALLSLAGHPVADPEDLLPFLEEERIGDPVAVRVARAGAVLDLSITVGAREGRRP